MGGQPHQVLIQAGVGWGEWLDGGQPRGPLSQLPVSPMLPSPASSSTYLFIGSFIHSFPSCSLSSPNQANARESFGQLLGSNENSREIYRHWGEYLGSEASQRSPVGGWGVRHRVSKGLQARVGRGLGGRRASWRREAGPPLCPREKPFGPVAMRAMEG